MSKRIAKKEVIKELIRCGKDPVYFLMNYAKIEHPQKGVLDFKLYYYQEDIIKKLLENRNNIILKARQLGITTIIGGFLAWLMIFHKHQNVLFLATKLEKSKITLRVIKTIIRYLPSWMKSAFVKIDINNRTSIELENGSRATAIATSSDAGIGEAVSFLFVDEAAHIEGIEQMWAQIFPTLSCVSGNTRVFTDDGPVEIKELCGNKKEIGFFNLDGKTWDGKNISPITQGYVSPESETLKITTRKGLELECTKIHPLMKLENTGSKMTSVQKLSIGDFLRVDVGMNCWGKRDLTKDNLAYMLGVYIAEGWAAKYSDKNDYHTVFISNFDNDVRDVFLKSKVIKPFHNQNVSDKLLCCSRKLVGLYEDLGIDFSQKCDTKRVPRSIWQSNKETVCGFLRGYFDGDGSVTSRGVVGSSTSKKLLQDIQLLLLNLGIISNITKSGDYQKKHIGKRKMPSGQILGSIKDSWFLIVSRSQFLLFEKYIGFNIKYKQSKLKHYCNLYQQDDRKLFKIPANIVADRILSIVEETGKSDRWFRLNGLRLDRVKKKKENTFINNKWIQILLNIIDENDLNLSYKDQLFLEELSNNCFWDSIVSIENSFSKTYDLTVPSTNMFLQNGILGSNTGGRCCIASTPKGAGNFFHKFWLNARDKIGTFNCRFANYVNSEDSTESYDDRFMYWVKPGCNGAWLKNETANDPPRDISQERMCFDGNTRIYTDLGFKKIKNIKIGDRVLTHKGNFKPVVYWNERVSKNNNILFKTTLNRKQTIVTGNHPLLSEKDGWKKSKSFEKRDIVSIFPKNVFISEENETIDLLNTINLDHFSLKILDTNNDYIFVNDRRYKRKHKRFVTFDYDLGYFTGLYLAEGCTSKNRVVFSFNYDHELHTWVKDLCDIVERKFGINNFKICKDKRYNSGSLIINSTILYKFVKTLTKGSIAPKKCLSKFSYKHGNKNFFKGILDGTFEGDGCLKEIYYKTLNITSENLIYDIKYILSMLGLQYVSLRTSGADGVSKILGRKVNICEQYCLKLLQTKDIKLDKVSSLLKKDYIRKFKYQKHYDENYNFYLSKIAKKEELQKEITVYNIEVADDNSFVTEHFVAHNCSFLASGDTFIWHEDIERLESSVRKPIKTFNIDRNVWIWQDPVPEGSYLISCDVARGDAQDYSAFHVIRLDSHPLEQVAEYKGKVKPDQLGLLLMSVSQLYNNAVIAPENNSGWAGQAVMKIEESGYPYLYYARRTRSKQKENYAADPYYAMQRNDFLPGYSVTSANRLPMLSKMEQYIRMGDIIVNSSRLVEEFKTFIVTNTNRPEAQRGMNDDLILALAGGLWVRDEAFLHVHRTDEVTKAMLGAMTNTHTKSSQYRDFDFNTSIYDRGRIQRHVEEQNKIVMANGDVVDLSWLLK